MVRLNVPLKPLSTHEGGVAKRINAEQQLRRSVMACLLWEREFYEDGVTIADRIASTIPMVGADNVAGIAIEARERMNLRHVPLLIVREMAHGAPTYRKLVRHTLGRVIQRPDELCEFLAIYWKDGRQPLSAQVKKGLADAFPKFDAYSLAKYNRDDAIKLRDVLFLCHAKPKDEEQAQTWRQLVDGTLAPPDTWEVALSGGADKRATWERLLSEKKLGGMALLRNLRNMNQACVDDELIRHSLRNIRADRILPFRFIAADRYGPQFEPELEDGLFRCIEGKPKLKGITLLLVDVSGSMEDRLSGRSEMERMDAASGVAMIAREVCEAVRVFTFSNDCVEIAPRRGFALRDAIVNSQWHLSTYLGNAVLHLNPRVIYDRIIVITDEQAHDSVPNPRVGAKGYVINVASAKNGVGYGAWMHIDGWSEAVLDYIYQYEAMED